MKSIEKPKLLIHIDVDSPLKLLEFYQKKGVNFEQKDLEKFYEISFNRAFDFFDKHKLKATFFVVGNELENSPAIQKVILKASSLGHEIENHTYSHPFGLTTLNDEEIISELLKCNEIIRNITSINPVGFRSPGYSINTNIINILKNNGFRYDSSGFWSIMNPILEYGHKFLFKGGLKNEGFGFVTSKLPHEPFFPENNNWQKKSGNTGNFIEIPLPRTRLSGLPFYNNINLWTPKLYSSIISKTIKRKKLVYLFHAIEFMDITDNLPPELSVHPNLKTPLDVKLERSGKIINDLLKRYEHISTRKLLNI